METFCELKPDNIEFFKFKKTFKNIFSCLSYTKRIVKFAFPPNDIVHVFSTSLVVM